MTPAHPDRPDSVLTTQTSPPSRSFPRRVSGFVNVLLVLVGIAMFMGAATRLAQNAARPKAEVPPQTMADVDWGSPRTSVYCLGCHWNVGLATAGLDARRGHSHNVALNELQLGAIRDMGTIAGEGNTLICMSCHLLSATGKPYMLADTLDDSRLCRRCHPGHYARNTPHDLRRSRPDEKNRRGQTAGEGGPCSACHLAHSYAREIIPSPLDPDGYCITCHQTYGVASDRARKQVMQHPESHCLQCHDSHDATHRAFLKNNPPEVCLQCHPQFDGGAAAGMHPLARMEKPVPRNLLDAGASAGADGHQVSCATCHSVHQAGCEDLLVVSTQTNELCLSCHSEMTPSDGSKPHSLHAGNQILNDSQRGVVASWGTRVGAQGELLCVSCHRVHGAEPSAKLLAFRPKYGEACIACHPEQESVMGTLHNLATKFPQAQNKAGLTPQAAGVCSPCHMAHQFPRERVPGPGDADGQCMSCHLAGRLAQTSATVGNEHPKTRCRECHNPHGTADRRFLVKPEEQLCQTCHPEQSRLQGGPHDIAQAKDPEKWNAAALEHGGTCLSCHVPHGGDQPGLFRIGGGAVAGNHDEVCLACHADAGWNASGVGAIHPQHISPDQNKVDLALVPRADSGELRIGCRTCHDPHGGREPVHLARVVPGESTESLCLRCHADKQYIKYTGHSAERLDKLGMDTDSCKPCHAMHADRDGTWGSMLSPRFLPRWTATDPQPDPVPCLACHRENGPAPFQKIATHPPRQLASVGKAIDPGHLPLFNANGHEDPQGEVACRTCHVSHGRLDLLKAMAENPNGSTAEQNAVRAQLRPFIEPNTCTTCHEGMQARMLFLRFHDPQTRAKMGAPVQ